MKRIVTILLCGGILLLANATFTSELFAYETYVDSIYFTNQGGAVFTVDDFSGAFGTPLTSPPYYLNNPAQTY